MRGMEWLEGDEVAEVMAELEEDETRERRSHLEYLAYEFPGIPAVEVAGLLGCDKRTVLKDAHLSTQIRLAGGRKGRGHKWRIYPLK